MADRERLPMVDGLTQTVRDTDPFVTRLADFLSQQSVPTQEDINTGLDALQRAFENETNEALKSRLATAILLLREGPPA